MSIDRAKMAGYVEGLTSILGRKAQNSFGSVAGAKTDGDNGSLLDALASSGQAMPSKVASPLIKTDAVNVQQAKAALEQFGITDRGIIA